jgi:hypothetical protein
VRILQGAGAGDVQKLLAAPELDPNDSVRIADCVRAQSSRCDGLIVTTPDEARIAAALREAAARIPW